MKKKILITVLSGIIASNAFAQNNISQGDITVQTRVQEICELSSTQINFGVIDFVGTGGSVSIPGTLSIRCTKGVYYKTKMNKEGIAPDGFRKLKKKDEINKTANYNLYLSGSSEVFGDGIFGRYIEGYGTGLKQEIKYDARISFDQTVEPGFYEDIVEVYIDY